MRVNAKAFAAGLAMILAVPSVVAQDSELDVLRQQFEAVKQDQIQRNRAILALERRIRQLENRRNSGTAFQDAADAQKAPRPRKPAVQSTPQPKSAAIADVPVPQPTAPPAVAETAAPTPASDPTPDTVKREAGPSRSVETIVEETQGLFRPGAVTVELGITYARFDRTQINLSGFLALDAIFLGNISVDEVESDILTVDLTGRYGVTDRLQVDMNVPMIYRTSNFQSGGAGGAATAQIEERVTENPRLGDVSAGLNYRILMETERRPDVVVSANVKAPTGRDPFGIELVEVAGSQGNLTVPTELPSGNGVWGASGGVSLLKTIDPVIVFGSITYFKNFKRSFDDIDSASGEQPGQVDIGDSIQFGLGTAFALNEQTSLTLSYTQRFVQKTQIQPDGQDRTEVIGSDANVAMMNFGLTYAKNDHLSVLGNIGIGLTRDAADVQLSLRLPYTF